jgi:hypothetical protein
MADLTPCMRQMRTSEVAVDREAWACRDLLTVGRSLCHRADTLMQWMAP